MTSATDRDVERLMGAEPVEEAARLDDDWDSLAEFENPDKQYVPPHLQKSLLEVPSENPFWMHIPLH